MELKHFEIHLDDFESPSLRGNRLGDPVARRTPVIVPKSCGREPGKRCPAIYVLAGFTGSGYSFLNWQGWTPSFPERLDRLRDRGAIGDIIAVLPDAFTRYGGSQYINSAATGRYEDMMVDDLIPWVDSRYPTLPAARHRGILGKSSGGYGALVLGMRHPDKFSAVACHSGDMYFEYCYKTDFPALLKLLEKHRGLEGFLEAFFAAPKKTGDLISGMNVVAMAAAYSPAPEKPGLVDLPFDPATGEISSDVWARWLAHDPVELCGRHAEGLRKLRLLFLDCGRQDQYLLQYGLRILSKRLERLGVAHVVEEFDDNHSDTAYRYDVSIPKVWESIRP
jgi:enterochelin esterase family protein